MAAEEELVIRLRLQDDLSKPLKVVKSELNAVGGSAKALHKAAESGSGKGTDALNTSLTKMHTLATNLGKKLDTLADKMGDKLAKAAKRGIEGVGALAAAMVTSAISTQKMIDQAQLTLTSFYGPGKEEQARGMLELLRQYGDIVNVGQAAQGTQQLLVNPRFQGRAPALVQALMNISAAQTNPGATYSGLATAIGRSEQLGRVNPRVLMMLGRQGVNIIPELESNFGIANTPQGERAVMQRLQSMPVDQMLSLIQTIGSSPRFKAAVAQRRGTLGGMFSFARYSVEEAIAGQSSPMTKALSGLIAGNGGPEGGPLVQAVVGLVTKVGPPLFKLLGDLLSIFTKLIPALTGVTTGLLKFSEPILRFVDKMVQIAAVRDILAGLLAALVGFVVVEKFISMFDKWKKAIQALMGVEQAEQGVRAAAGEKGLCGCGPGTGTPGGPGGTPIPGGGGGPGSETAPGTPDLAPGETMTPGGVILPKGVNIPEPVPATPTPPGVSPLGLSLEVAAGRATAQRILSNKGKVYGEDIINKALAKHKHRARGGPVQAGESYVVGEDGQELFVAGQSGTILPAGGGTQMHFHGPVAAFYGPVGMSPAEISAAVSDGIKKAANDRALREANPPTSWRAIGGGQNGG